MGKVTMANFLPMFRSQVLGMEVLIHRLCWWFLVVVDKMVAKMVDKMFGSKVVDLAIDIVSISTSRVWRLQGDLHHWAPEDKSINCQLPIKREKREKHTFCLKENKTLCFTR